MKQFTFKKKSQLPWSKFLKKKITAVAAGWLGPLPTSCFSNWTIRKSELWPVAPLGGRMSLFCWEKIRNGHNMMNIDELHCLHAKTFRKDNSNSNNNNRRRTSNVRSTHLLHVTWCPVHTKEITEQFRCLVTVMGQASPAFEIDNVFWPTRIRGKKTGRSGSGSSVILLVTASCIKTPKFQRRSRKLDTLGEKGAPMLSIPYLVMMLFLTQLVLEKEHIAVEVAVLRHPLKWIMVSCRCVAMKKVQPFRSCWKIFEATNSVQGKVQNSSYDKSNLLWAIWLLVIHVPVIESPNLPGNLCPVGSPYKHPWAARKLRPFWCRTPKVSKSSPNRISWSSWHR